MTDVTTKLKHDCCDTEDNHYQIFVKGINKAAKRQYAKVMDFIESGKVRLVRTTIDLFALYLASFDNSRVQQYNCTACAQFLNGIGTFAIINDDNRIIPLVFDLNDTDWIPNDFRTAFKNITSAFDEKHAGQLTIVTTAMVDQLGDFLGKTTSGGFNHFALDMPRVAVVNDFKCSAFDTVAKKHGVGKEEITAIHTWLRSLIDFDFNTVLNLDQMRVSDRDILVHIYDAVTQYKNLNPDVYVRRILMDVGLTLLYLKNSAAGAVITELQKGTTLEDALICYKGYVDPRFYKRPIRLPSEKAFEDSVKFLEENGYAEKLPVRFSTPEEAYALCNWIKPEIKADTAPKGIFDNLRKKVENKSTVPEATAKQELPVESISMNSLVGFIEELIETNTLIGVRHVARLLQFGSFVTCQNEDGYQIYQDGKNTRYFYLNDPVRDVELMHYIRPHTPADETITGLIVLKDEYGRPQMNFVKENHAWMVPISSVVIPDDLIKEIQPHRRTIEHWAKSTLMNRGDDGQVIVYENIMINIGVSVGHGVYLETPERIYRFDITSLR